ncbi:DevR family CRISPR-associated autoregulator [Candidatus Bathyarchaeota archaeon]|nr:MAG: DevR family CRISPR-associated autoregulator [Candidatus Bathyarchaeota archaeon]
MSEEVYEIGIVGKIRIDAHSLNNEGTVGNVTEPRTIMLADGRKTDGISGEMLKHMHTEAFWQLAKERNVTLCQACQMLRPEKANKNPNVTKVNEVKEALNEALKCALCDIHGFLVEKPTLSRKSTIEFGWAIAIPEQFYRDIHVHTRVAPGEKGKEAETEQMIYNRPTRSGVYAFISIFQPWRIGLNEINYEYVPNDEDRKERYELVIDAYKAMLSRLEGAMTTTRLPHTSEIEGLIIIATNAMPVPLISPLKDDYKVQIEKIVEQKNIQKFNSLVTALQELDKLKTYQPYKLGAT